MPLKINNTNISVAFSFILWQTGAGVAQSVWRLGYGLSDVTVWLWFPSGVRISLFWTAPTPGLGPPSILTSGHRQLLPGAQSGRIVTLTTKLRLVPRLKAVWDYLPQFHGKSYPITGLDRSLELQETEAPRISKQSGHEDGEVVSSTHQPSFPSRRYPSTDFC
jgi:hypothetical protein